MVAPRHITYDLSRFDCTNQGVYQSMSGHSEFICHVARKPLRLCLPGPNSERLLTEKAASSASCPATFLVGGGSGLLFSQAVQPHQRFLDQVSFPLPSHGDGGME